MDEVTWEDSLIRPVLLEGDGELQLDRDVNGYILLKCCEFYFPLLFVRVGCDL